MATMLDNAATEHSSHHRKFYWSAWTWNATHGSPGYSSGSGAKRHGFSPSSGHLAGWGEGHPKGGGPQNWGRGNRPFVLSRSVVSDSLRPHRDCGLSGSSAHGILQARLLEWVAISSSRGSSQPRDWTHISCVFCCIAGRFFTCWALGLTNPAENKTQNIKGKMPDEPTLWLQTLVKDL